MKLGTTSKLGEICKVAAALGLSSGLTAGVLMATAGTSLAEYGPGAAYQVEISANTASGSFWIWAELTPSVPGGTSGTSGDYEETDCVHLSALVQGPSVDAAANDAGSVTRWSVANGILAMNGVNIIGDAETATITVPVTASGYGHTNGMALEVTAPDPAPPGLLPYGVPLSFPSQNQVAP
jgi:hypothetical protein